MKNRIKVEGLIHVEPALRSQFRNARYAIYNGNMFIRFFREGIREVQDVTIEKFYRKKFKQHEAHYYHFNNYFLAFAFFEQLKQEDCS